MGKYSKIEISKLTLSLFAFWIVGVIIALFAGLGWFFLIEALRRILFLIPRLNTAVVSVILGRTVTEDTQNPPSGPLSVAMRLLIILAWILMTIFVFWKANIRITD